MLNKINKEQVINSFRKSDQDTGSCEVQIGLLSERIGQVAQHLEQFPKDKHSRHGLIKMVGKRRTLLGYLKKNDLESHHKITSMIGRNKKSSID